MSPISCFPRANDRNPGTDGGYYLLATAGTPESLVLIKHASLETPPIQNNCFHRTGICGCNNGWVQIDDFGFFAGIETKTTWKSDQSRQRNNKKKIRALQFALSMRLKQSTISKRCLTCAYTVWRQVFCCRWLAITNVGLAARAVGSGRVRG